MPRDGLPQPARFTCAHAGVDARTLQCPKCSGIMRRCCDSALGAPHRGECGETSRREKAKEEVDAE